MKNLLKTSLLALVLVGGTLPLASTSASACGLFDDWFHGSCYRPTCCPQVHCRWVRGYYQDCCGRCHYRYYKVCSTYNYCNTCNTCNTCGYGGYGY